MDRNVPATESDLGVLRGLESVVQYMGKEYGASPTTWRTMAAFDSHDAAESYAMRCENNTWDYRVVDVVTDRTGEV